MKVGENQKPISAPPVQESESRFESNNNSAVDRTSESTPKQAEREGLAQPGKLQQLMGGGGVQKGEQFARGKNIITAAIRSAAQTGSISDEKMKSNPKDRAWMNVAMSLVHPGGGVSATPINLPGTANGTTAGGAPRGPGGGVSATPINLPRTIDQVVDHVKQGDLGSARMEWDNIVDQMGGEDRDGMIQHVLHRAFVEPNANLTAIGDAALTPEKSSDASGMDSLLLDEASTLNRMFLMAHAFAQNEEPRGENPVQG